MSEQPKKKYRKNPELTEKVNEAMRAERKRIRERIRYQLEREQRCAYSREYHRLHIRGGNYAPRKYQHLADPRAAYLADLAIKRHAKMKQLSEQEIIEHRQKRAEQQRRRREEKGSEVRAYQREYHRKWAAKNAEKVYRFNVETRIRKKMRNELEGIMEKREEKLKKK